MFSLVLLTLVSQALAFEHHGTITHVPRAAQTVAAAATTALPLTAYEYAYNDLPYQVNPYRSAGENARGPQTGYNQCNSTTEGPDSLCQTAIFNSIEDFCLWGSAIPNGIIGEMEESVVAYCSRAGHGTRIFPPGTITGIQFIKTPAYIQVVGFMNQVGFQMEANDYGGELDPHGADLLGNPLGGLVYSDNIDGNGLTQVKNWNNFMGNNIFCFKACYNNVTRPNYCQNRYDLVGCNYNMPADYKNNEFVSCEGDVQDPMGWYTDEAGARQTWSQPDPLPTDYVMPYAPKVPQTSNCVTYKSEDIFPTSALGYQSTGTVGAAAATPTATTTSGTDAAAAGTATTSTSGDITATTATATNESAAQTSGAKVVAGASTTAALGSASQFVPATLLGLFSIALVQILL